ncbi:hypothetical protein IHE49_06655 [Rhodanobacter sp. 7MK24]|uniref:hypothetical protein n=1 Tax=Rhodanobacter sp. 7MK24 TaxID=2775922 RepID=UPI001781D420|nr:hypothetical protein [Rhodanobacter sp. 7MK24]MBD8880156.1 hypothetical protein [Rhodanobacter sp. 7MK24]
MKEAFQNFMVECADVDNLHEVIEAIGSEAMHELVAEVTPVLGVVTSSVKLARAGKAVVIDAHNLYKSDDYKRGFRRAIRMRRPRRSRSSSSVTWPSIR